MRKSVWGIALVLAVLAGWSCSRIEEYPPQEVDEFLRGCEEAAQDKLKDYPGGPEAAREKARQYCACAVDKVQKTISYHDFKKLKNEKPDLSAEGSAAVRKMFEIVAQCQAEILGQATKP